TLLSFKPRRKARRAQIGVQRILEQLDDHGRLRAAAIGLPAFDEGVVGPHCEVERHAELLAELYGEAQILERQIHGEGDIIASIEDELAFRLMHETGA